jgi:hypothetical protein
MKTVRGRIAGAAAVLAAAGWLAGAAGAGAAGVHGMDTIKKAKELGITSVTNCQSCHVDKLPKKNEPQKLNDMGKWLMDQKEARKAKEIDVAWLKEYKPAK